MKISRRSLVKSGAIISASAGFSRNLMASYDRRHKMELEIQDKRYKEIGDVSIELAIAEGASYADVRMDHKYLYNLGASPNEGESMSIGVRVLVDGYWGFASSPVWTKSEAVRLARAAMRNARAHSVGKARYTELAPLDLNTQQLTGHWSTPIVDDPFEISKEEIEDFFMGVSMYVYETEGILPQFLIQFQRQDKIFISSVGHYITQRLYESSGGIGVRVKNDKQEVNTSLDTTTPTGAGFELFRGQPLREQIKELIAETRKEMELPVIPVDVGRFSAVLDAMTVANLLSDTIGAATEIDRSLGYEANAGGTSYIVDPIDMIGSFKIGSQLLNVTANRNELSGVATVGWDDEGVAPSEFALIKDGILNDMQTDREGAVVLKDIYNDRNGDVRSHGCSYAPESGLPALTHSANLKVTPGPGSETFDSLIEGVSKGIAFKRGGADMDFQKISGVLSGTAFEIKDGKRVARVVGAGALFRTPELWNSIMEIGGESSAKRYGIRNMKGQPMRISTHSVTGIPMLLKDASVIDIFRKA